MLSVTYGLPVTFPALFLKNTDCIASVVAYQCGSYSNARKRWGADLYATTIGSEQYSVKMQGSAFNRVKFIDEQLLVFFNFNLLTRYFYYSKHVILFIGVQRYENLGALPNKRTTK